MFPMSRNRPNGRGRTLLLSGLLGASLALSVGCGEENDGNEDDEHDHDAHVSVHEAHDAGMHGGDGGALPCDAPDLEEGAMAHGTEALMVTLVDFDHAPPQLQENNWVVEVTTHDGTPVEDVELEVDTWMPVHGHDGKFRPTIEPVEGSPGQFSLDNVHFTMEGPWEVRFTLSSESEGDDYIVMDVCVGG